MSRVSNNWRHRLWANGALIQQEVGSVVIRPQLL
jgi:hypothetical protein